MRAVNRLGKMVKRLSAGFEEFADTGFRYIEVPRGEAAKRPKKRSGGKLVKTGLEFHPAGFVPAFPWSTC